VAGHFDIFTSSRTSFPASCTVTKAIYAFSGSGLEEADCKNQAEGCKE
jgi:hypothetical protein